MLRTRIVSAFALAAVALSGAQMVRAGDDEKGFTKILNQSDLKGWTIVPESAKDTFTIKEGVVDVSGKPNGYFATEKSYKNYVLRFEWKFLKDGNSGTLVHITGAHKVWPKCIEVQGQQKDHGRIFAIGGAKGKFTVDKKAQAKAIKIGDWNTTEIVSMNGKLTSKINGVEVSTGEGELTEGTIGFQSEGAPLQYKNIRIKALD